MDPKSYSNTDTAETESITILRGKLDHKYLKLDIKERDKYPNIDGYIEIVDEKQIPIGKLEIQVKTIKKDPYYYIDSSSLAYVSKVAMLPVLLILVNREESKVYWLQLSKNIGTRTNGGSYKVLLQDLDCITKTSNHIQKWIIATTEYQRRIKEFPILKELLDANKYTKPIEEIDATKLEYLQRFIDFLNASLDREFRIIKETLFSGVWKLGIAVTSFNESLSFGLYAIKYGELDSTLIKSFDHKGFGIDKSRKVRSIYYTSQIPEDPIKLAKVKLKSFFNDLLKSENFPLILSEVANEYIFFVVNKYHYAFGFDKERSQYSLLEIKKSLENFFFKWTYAAYKSIKYPSHLNYIDISMISIFTDAFSRKKISDEVRISKEDFPFYNFYTKEFSIFHLMEAIEILQNEKVEYVFSKVPLPVHDRRRLKNSNWIYHAYTEEELETKIKLQYFEAHYHFDKYMKAIGLSNRSDENNSLLISPLIEINVEDPYVGAFTLLVKPQAENKFKKYEFIKLDEEEIQMKLQTSNLIEINGEMCEIQTESWIGNIPIFDDMPIRSFILEKLKDFGENSFELNS
ncbi:DUF4365 domain-containing protein [Leptospira mayottensis]|uniref:DUF4365 domain-containing protein n=1 Tax=Leptospira mayottensis TaxID=1137606 RepID=UPI000E35B182|nr:DUF4365 domain-containing protein [Leptospira mayottensis]AXR68711.1 hypothetical protein DPV73_12560 [Leptospira mayottensis]